MNRTKNNYRVARNTLDDSPSYYQTCIQTKVFPIPVGTEVSFRIYLWRFGFHGETILTGKIEKLLYPGYFKRYDHSDCLMKYCIGNIPEIPGSSFTISESSLINPDGLKLYYDECYRINFFNSLNNSSDRTGKLRTNSSRESKGSINFTNISGIFEG